MEKTKKYVYSAVLGAGGNDKNGYAYAENMINENGVNKKRNGVKNIAELTDLSLVPLRINGIFSYKYQDKDKNTVCEKIVHAKNKIFKCTENFSSLEEIEAVGVEIKDQKSHAISMGDKLFICGAGELLIYDGNEIKSAYQERSAYVPTTLINSKDISSKERGVGYEKQNLLTPRRINKFTGTDKGVESPRSVFRLDSRIKESTRFSLKITLRTTGGEENDLPKTSYIGINSNGDEEEAIVTLIFERDSIKGNTPFFVSQPIVDSYGNEMSLKIGEKVYKSGTLPLGIMIKNGREISMPFEVVSPDGQDNIEVEYETENEITKGILKDSKIIALGSGENGKEMLLANFGDNRVYFSDKEKGIFYMPVDNAISFGGEGEKITSIVRLSDNIIGVFKENSFYRLRFTSSSERGYEIYYSTDQCGAYNHTCATAFGKDCLVFNSSGVFGVDSFKSGDSFNCLNRRSNQIDTYLKAHTREEKENAISFVLNGRYYLIVGEKIYIADQDIRTKGTGTDGYEWWIWTGVGARSILCENGTIYFGGENGQIKVLTDDFYDCYLREYKTDGLGLICRVEDNGTRFVIASDYQNREERLARLSKHYRLIGSEVEYREGALKLGDLIYSEDGAHKIFPEMNILITDVAKNIVCKDKITDVFLVSGDVKISTSLTEGARYNVYLEVIEAEYPFECEATTLWLYHEGKPIKIIYENELTLSIVKKHEINGVYKTPPLTFGDETKKKTLKRIYLKVPRYAKGIVGLEIETKRVKISKEINLGSAFDFDSLDFDSVSFDSELDSMVTAPVFIRGFECLTLKISSSGNEPFGIDAIIFEYKEENS